MEQEKTECDASQYLMRGLDLLMRKPRQILHRAIGRSHRQ
jgi:hypothetical protein